jgi:ArsR family transcriptional regulator
VSYHLKRLTDVGLLEREKRGTFAYYRLAPEAIGRVRALFA